MTEGIIIFCLSMNIVGFTVCYWDKRAAVKGQWRVPEKNLLIMGLAGGAVGIFVAMLMFRHKTKHIQFMVGMPLIIILNLYVLMRVMERIGN